MFLTAKVRVLQSVCVVAVVSLAVVAGARASAEDAAPKKEAPKGMAYSGTFTDTAGHKGPMKCQVLPDAGDAYTLKITAENQGSGPNRKSDFILNLKGKKEGETTNLSGPGKAGRSEYEVTVAVTAATAEGKFKSADGKNSGTFSLKAQ